VLDSRHTEFLYEGMRWFDILRWNIPVVHRMITGETSTLTPDDDRRVVQLPRNAELSGLQMNPYDHIPQPWN
ncbi:MAG: RagB/SusD family nutrient uptake outer membrane protein, partial [Alistipes sp.]|nr:RagB/SusD family nutrient uptake outer membrane protein [Alistipes sp.]